MIPALATPCVQILRASDFTMAISRFIFYTNVGATLYLGQAQFDSMSSSSDLPMAMILEVLVVDFQPTLITQ